MTDQGERQIQESASAQNVPDPLADPNAGGVAPGGVADASETPPIPIARWWNHAVQFARDPGAMFLITCLTFLAVVFYACFAYRQAVATREAADAAREANHQARDIFEATERPWVYANIAINGPPEWTADTVSIPLRFFVKNVGKSPAAHVSVDVFLAGNPSALVAEQKKRCDQIRGDPTHDPRQPSFTVFPGQDVASFVVTVSAKIDAMRWKADDNRITPGIVGCIDYQSTWDSRHHQTPIAYRLDRVKAAQPGAGFAIEIGKPLSIDELNLWTLLGIDAN